MTLIRSILSHLLVGGTMFLAGFISHELLHAPWGGPALIWLPSGIATLFFLLYKNRFFIALYAGSLLFHLLVTEAPSLLTPLLSLISLFMPWITAQALLKYLPSLSFERHPKQLIIFLSITASISLLTTVIIGMIAHFGGLFYFPITIEAILRLFFADWLSMMLIIPWLLSWLKSTTPFTAKQIRSLAILSGILLLIAIFLFYPHHEIKEMRYIHAFSFLLLPPLVYAALFYTTRIATTLILTSGTMTLFATSRFLGPFGDGSFTSALMAQSFVALTSILSLLFLSNSISRRRIEYKLNRLNQSLEKRIAREKEKIENQQRILLNQSKMAAMGEMVGAIAHQWRQPLNNTGLIIQNILDAYRHGELTASYLEEMVRNAMHQIRFMSRTIDDFRNFFKPDKKKILFELRQVLEESFSLLHSQFVHYNIKIELHVDLDYQETMIYGYPNEFKQAVINILSNAKDAILEHRLDRKESFEGLIVVKIEIHHHMATISFEDNGGGIPPEIIERTFEPYFTTKEEGKGSGIGLYMTKMVIEKSMGGRVWAANGSHGAIFTIELPIAPNQPENPLAGL